LWAYTSSWCTFRKYFKCSFLCLKCFLLACFVEHHSYFKSTSCDSSDTLKFASATLNSYIYLHVMIIYISIPILDMNSLGSSNYVLSTSCPQCSSLYVAYNRSSTNTCGWINDLIWSSYIMRWRSENRGSKTLKHLPEAKLLVSHRTQWVSFWLLSHLHFLVYP